MTKKQKIIFTGTILDKEQRKNFKKDHPGYRLAFSVRHPYSGLYISITALVIALVTLLLKL